MSVRAYVRASVRACMRVRCFCSDFHDNDRTTVLVMVSQAETIVW